MYSKAGNIKITLAFLLLVSISTYSQVKLPRLISDGMVLQRNAKVKIWGWAAKNEKVSVSFKDSVYRTISDNNGNWEISLSGLNAGGPFTMIINASNTIKINDIMIGDVWICSGQSNMELPMKRVSPVYEAEISNSENPYIRHFTVPQKYDFNNPQNDIQSGNWEIANPKNVVNFSAVSYFFGKELYEKYHVPIGLINASLGGSPAESWISEESIKKFPDIYKEAQKFKDSSLITQIESSDKIRIGSWYNLLQQKDEGYKDTIKPWFNPSINTSDWNNMKIPGYWANGPLGAINGVVWFRKDFTVPASMVGKPVNLNLGCIVDADFAYVNGIFVGTTGYQYPPRRYEVPSNVLKEGENTIVVRVISNIGKGGFVLDKPYELVSGDQKIDLKGEWKYKLGARMEPLAGQTFIRWEPVGLYNAMISPLLNYSIKGAIWYQGESNTGRPVEYRELLPALINDWRKNWKQGDFPFLIVQLANFMESTRTSRLRVTGLC